ncbi:MAG TPA: DUF4255 domain-containing protein [Chitinophagaceae bacterium]|nr:DUF4255 domain-containing protein [Chitinophagaceae bacterium]
MIDQALDFICKQVNAYLSVKLNITDGSSLIQLANISWNDSESTASNGTDKSNAFLSLVNIEEDRISKSPQNYIRSGSSVVYKNPKIFLNLYLLFSVNLTSYSESLKRLSYIIQFFQYQNVFNQTTNPSLPAGIDELILDLVTLSYQDLNNLWGIMGSKYLPSVMYKLRLINIDENFAMGASGLVTEVVVNDKTLQQ